MGALLDLAKQLQHPEGEGDRPLIPATEEHRLKALGRSWRWNLHYPDGRVVEIRVLPEPTEAELRPRYPEVVRFEPLPETLQ